ncbi:amino acid permease/ SLC12A domain-containing protein [Penicillium capsulatum]|uniref:Amino acid permease/ SLC12A domain-containing protein n=1 Tax=Penicillium capsulatum TaxID=69766 RepID=A0A9W9LK63_9EURO|nr:amino acid permease/ SLC12A domain-containing protein [Penicillium capsulatum]KAJ6116644.1 amino acid permease/ SLC12A domain-containing protein [Penicillium capsulatum]
MDDNRGAEYTSSGEKDLERNVDNSKDRKLNDSASFTGIADASTSEVYGHVQRDLKARHVSFIALGGNIGTGLFLGIGRALQKSGCRLFWEMAAWLPLPGAIPQFCARYTDEALGFAVGWNTWFNAAITLCAEISAACSLIQYWEGAHGVSVAVWIIVLIVALFALNTFAVGIYGESEFVCAAIKLVGIIGLLILALVIDLGGVPTQPRLGFHYWKTDGAMKEYISTDSAGRFLGFFSTLVNASFSLGGAETVIVAAGEAENPRRNIPRAMTRVFWRFLIFYVFAAFALGLMCPSSSSKLLGASSADAESPWVVAVKLAGIKALPSIVNVLVLIAAISAGNLYVFRGSRYLYALAQHRQAPKIFLRCTAQGIPIWALLNLNTVSGLYTWISICITYLRFHAALKAQNVNRKFLPFSFPLQPYSTYFTLGYLCVIVFFNGFDSIAGGWDVAHFITSYIGFPLFFGLFTFWKFFKKMKWKSSEEADLFTGKAELDAVEWPLKRPRNMAEKIWLWII